MSLRLRHEVLRLALRDPFVIARSEHGAGRAITTVVVELESDAFPGLVGLGEGYPDRFYGETPETMAAVFPMLIEAAGPVEASTAWLAGAGGRMAAAIRWNGAAIVVSSFPVGISHDRLATHLVERYLLRSMFHCCGDRNGGAYSVWISHHPLQDFHATHRTANNRQQLFYSQMVYQMPLRVYHVSYSNYRKIQTISLPSLRVYR